MADRLHEFLFHQGTNYRSYEYFGCHKGRDEAGREGFFFRTWAATAKGVSVVGDFNGWDGQTDKCRKLTEKGVWEAFVPNAKQWDNYKFLIISKDGRELLKADPYGAHHQTEGESASKVYALPDFKWEDRSFLDYRANTNVFEKPANIYECHIGSWKKHGDGNYYSYRNFADEAIPYIKGMGYTHIELMGVAEHPFDGSWGYQVTGYFAPTSRYGTPEDFMYLVNAAHVAGMGVIFDWVPGHFPRDEHGLRQFDGTPQYEYQDPKKGEHKEWGTLVFDFGREEVQSFLVSNAIYWMDKFHIDGLRVDAVASMLYLDYSRKPGEWLPNSRGGNENLEAVAFFQKLNTEVFRAYPGVMMIAEESTAWPLVTKPVDAGGLGFNFKWNMGWMNDTLSYVETDPYFRNGNHNKLTFSFVYAFSENYILPISHDEVVYGKRSLLKKFFGDENAQIASMRGFLTYMAAHPGKKLAFMGTEFMQENEWNYKTELDWGLLEREEHRKFRDFVSELNHFYLSRKELWEVDYSWEGCKMLVADDSASNVIAFLRIAKDGRKLLSVTSFSPVERRGYEIGTPEGSYEQVFCSAEPSDPGNNWTALKTVKKKNHGSEHTLTVDIPPFASIFFEHKPEIKRKKPSYNSSAAGAKKRAPKSGKHSVCKE